MVNTRFIVSRQAAGLQALVALGLLLSNAPASAAGDGFSDVSFTVSGAPNAWIVDFTVVPLQPSNMAIGSYISTFQLGVEGGTDLAQPGTYLATTIGGATAWTGAKGVSPNFYLSAPGGISGFETLVSTLAAPTDIGWSVSLASGTTLNDFYVHGAYQATVSDSGIAHVGGTVSPAPEVSTASLMAMGLGTIAVLLRRRGVPRAARRTASRAV